MSTRIASQQLAFQTARTLVRRQADLADTQSRISSGKRLNRPSDDPARANRLVELDRATRELDQYDRNVNAIKGRLSLQETTITGVVDTLSRLRELAVAANNATLDKDSHQAILTEVELHLDALYDYANTRDGEGRYLFSGTNTDTIPFSPASPVQYFGTDTAHQLNIAGGRLITSADTGRDIFMSLRSGNGTFDASADAGNTGSGTIVENSLLDAASYTGNDYQIVFTSPTTYDVLDLTLATTVQSGTYNPGEGIVFDDLSVVIDGTPATGDTFDVVPSTDQDVFNQAQQFITALSSAPTTMSGKAAQRQGFATAISDLTNAIDHMNTYRSRTGSRLRTLDSSLEENAAVRIQLAGTKAEIEDLDMVGAVVKLEAQANSLEVLQKSYVRIQSLNLFDYL